MCFGFTGKNRRSNLRGILPGLDELKASGRLEALIRSGLESLRKLCPYRCTCRRTAQAVTVRWIGPDRVFARLWKECAIQEGIQCIRLTNPIWSATPDFAQLGG
jgi:hypothetical protein